MVGLKGVCFLCLVLMLASCSTFTGYHSLNSAEKNHYLKVADRMSVGERMEYLEKKSEQERNEYLASLGLGFNTPTGAGMIAINAKPESTQSLATSVAVPDAQPNETKPMPSNLELKADSAENVAAEVVIESGLDEVPEKISRETPMASEFVEEENLLLQNNAPASDFDPIAFQGKADGSENLLPHEKAKLIEKGESEMEPVAPHAKRPTFDTRQIREESIVESQPQARLPVQKEVPSERVVEEVVPEEAIAKPQEKDLEESVPQRIANEERKNFKPLKYEKTGDPVLDVLTLLELFENGKISREEFEREKELALGSN